MLEGFLALRRVQTAPRLAVYATYPQPTLHKLLFSPFGVSKAKGKYLGCQTNSLVFNFLTYFNA